MFNDVRFSVSIDFTQNLINNLVKYGIRITPTSFATTKQSAQHLAVYFHTPSILHLALWIQFLFMHLCFMSTITIGRYLYWYRQYIFILYSTGRYLRYNAATEWSTAGQLCFSQSLQLHLLHYEEDIFLNTDISLHDHHLSEAKFNSLSKELDSRRIYAFINKTHTHSYKRIMYQPN